MPSPSGILSFSANQTDLYIFFLIATPYLQIISHLQIDINNYFFRRQTLQELPASLQCVWKTGLISSMVAGILMTLAIARILGYPASVH
jgi:hypothetical protein